MLLWLWCRLAATAPMRPLAWEISICRRSGPRKGKKTKERKKERKKKKKKKKYAPRPSSGLLTNSLKTNDITTSQSAMRGSVSTLGYYISFHLRLEMHTHSHKFFRLRTASEAMGCRECVLEGLKSPSHLKKHLPLWLDAKN